MTRRIAILLTLLLAASARSESPLSGLGYGWQASASSVRASGMGSAALAAPDTLALDLLSPANWSGRHVTRFGFGVFISHNNASDRFGDDASGDGGFTGVGFAAPVYHSIILGATLTPYTTLSYRQRWTDTLDWSEATTRRQGDGGLSQVLIGASLPMGQNARLGLAERVILGKIERLWAVSFTESGANSASETISDRYDGFGWSLSGAWSDGTWGAGAVINTPLEATVEHRKVVASGGAAQVDSTSKLSEKTELPLEASFGVSRRCAEHLFALEFAWQRWGSVKKQAGIIERIDDGTRASAGWEWTPKYRSLDPAWRELSYRAGFYTTGSYALPSSGRQPRRFALTAGIGVPYAANASRLDIAVELGWTGDKTQVGVRERHFLLTFGLNHSELWFTGRRER